MNAPVPDETKSLAAITALNHMFAGRHFDICTIDSIAKMLGVQPDKDAYNTLRPLHCINWVDMPTDLRKAVPGLVQQCIAGGFQAVQFTLQPVGDTALQVLDGCKQTRRPLLQRWLK